MAVLGTLTMEDLTKLRKMTKANAEIFLSQHTLTDEERETANRVVGRDLNLTPSVQAVWQLYDPTRRLWITAAWLAGASWRQLARLHEVAPQTLMVSADRLLTSSERQALRLRAQMSLEALSAYRSKYVQNAEMLSTMSPQAVAHWLLTNTELDNET